MKRHIRSAITADFATLVAIDQSCFEEDIAYDANELRYFMSLPNATTLIAEVDGIIAGFLVVNMHGARSRATLVTLDVRDIYRNAGIGSELLARSEDLLAKGGTKRYALQVDRVNSVAFKFYIRHGFCVVRTLRNYYPNGADAYLMEKRVADWTGLSDV